ncbi:MAG: hypothetical protein ACR2HR_17440 [Euzebya sp.]
MASTLVNGAPAVINGAPAVINGAPSSLSGPAVRRHIATATASA